MKNNFRMRLKKIEKKLDTSFLSKGIFILTREINGKLHACLVNISPHDHSLSYHLDLVFPAKNNWDKEESENKGWFKLDKEYLEKQPLIANMLTEKGYLLI